MNYYFNPISSDRLILDVGANHGQDGLQLALNNPEAHVIAFEPVPEMIQSIHLNHANTVKSYGSPLNNYTLIDVALSDFNGTAEFNVAGQSDWGCSSLNTFSEHLDQTWPGRVDFKVTKLISVKVCRLDTILNDIPFRSITYLHCDTQGSDLSVLRGLGEFRRHLVKGVIETATSRTVALYREQQLLEDVCFDFVRWGFEIIKILPNDPYYNEVNVEFQNKFFIDRI